MARSETLPSKQIASRLASLDWSFSDAPREVAFHPYPARFISEIPRALIEVINPSGPILDPFCGSGTTLLEGRKLSRTVFGSDLNPIACLISRVRATKFSDNDLRQARSISKEILHASRSAENADRFEEIPRLDHWFSRAAKLSMAGALSALEELDPDSNVFALIATGISAATVRVSNQDSDTRYAAECSMRTQDESAQLIYESIRNVVKWAEYNQPLLPSSCKCVVRQSDARNLSFLPDNSIGLSIFSPPYPNAYEYWLYHKYRMYWLGYDPIAVKTSEIGARAHYSKRNGLTESDFQAQMTDVYVELFRVLRPDAHAAAVVGDSIIGGRTIDNSIIVSNAAKAAGFHHVVTVKRKTSAKRSSFNRAHSKRRDIEYVVVVTKA